MSLNRKPEEYSLYDILIVTEDKIQEASCACIADDSCPDKHNYCTLNTYQELDDLITDYLKNKTIKDLMYKK